MVTDDSRETLGHWFDSHLWQMCDFFSFSLIYISMVSTAYIIEGHRPSRKYISLAVVRYTLRVIGTQKIYILGVSYFLDVVKNLTSHLFPWWLNPPKNNLWWSTLNVIAISLAIYPWRSFLKCCPPRIISFLDFMVSLRVFYPQGYSILCS